MYKESRNVLKLELNLKTVSFKALLLQMMNLSSRGKSRVSQSKLEESVPESGSILPVSLYVRVTALYTLQPDLQSLDLWEWNTKTAYRIALDTVRIGERKA